MCRWLVRGGGRSTEHRAPQCSRCWREVGSGKRVGRERTVTTRSSKRGHFTAQIQQRQKEQPERQQTQQAQKEHEQEHDQEHEQEQQRQHQHQHMNVNTRTSSQCPHQDQYDCRYPHQSQPFNDHASRNKPTAQMKRDRSHQDEPHHNQDKCKGRPSPVIGPTLTLESSITQENSVVDDMFVMCTLKLFVICPIWCRTCTRHGMGWWECLVLPPSLQHGPLSHKPFVQLLHHYRAL